ncbi:MAG: RIP metalloprotease RseP [Pseudomonadota bacterium]
MMGVLTYYILPFIAMLAVLVFVHELGHYLAARRCGVRVEVFSVGFGREIFGWTAASGTRWRVGWVPIGGYVRFASVTTSQSESETFESKSLLARIAIVVGGPFANILFAVLALGVLFWLYGERTTAPIVGSVMPAGPAATAGIEPGDHVLTAGGQAIKSFEELRQLALLDAGRSMALNIDRDGTRLEFLLQVEEREIRDLGGLKTKVGELGMRPAHDPIVFRVDPNGPAAAAGLSPGDKILTVNGQAIAFFEELQSGVRESDGKPLSLGLLRNGQELSVALQPVANEGGTWLIGIERNPTPRTRLSLAASLVRAVEVSADLLVRTANYVGEMIVGSRNLDQLSGPIRVAQFTGQASALGLEQLVMLAALISLNLGIVNLLPIPALDGGYLVFFAIEAIRRRKLSAKAIGRAQRLGLLSVLVFVLFVIGNDLVQTGLLERASALVSSS